MQAKLDAMGRAETGAARGRWPPLVAALLVGTAYLATCALQEPEGFWIVDNANKYLQVRNIVDSDYRDFSLPWPGAEVDPELRYFSIPPPFAFLQGERAFSLYPPLFAAVSSVPYRWLGPRGLYVLPLLFSVVCLAGVGRLAGALGAGPGLRVGAVLAAGLTTPLWFYSNTFWEHALSLAFVVWGSVFFVRYLEEREPARLVAGSVSLALATWFREELVLLFGVMALATLWRAGERRLRLLLLCGAAYLVALLPFFAFQWAALGHPLGFHVQSALSGSSDYLASRPLVLYRLLLAAHPDVWVSCALLAPFALLLVARPRLDRSRFDRAIPLLAIAATVVGLVALSGFASGRIAEHLLASNSLLPAAPVIALALVRREGEESAGADWLGSVIAGFILVYWLAAPDISSQGIHWGNRFLLVLYPLLATLAAINVGAWARSGPSRASWAPVVLVVVLGLGAQIYSVRLLREAKAYSERLDAEVARRHGAVIVTDLWWLGQTLPREYLRRPIFLLRPGADPEPLGRALVEAGHRDVLRVGSPSRAVPGSIVIEDTARGFFSVALSPATLGGQASARSSRSLRKPTNRSASSSHRCSRAQRRLLSSVRRVTRCSSGTRLKHSFSR